MLVLVSPFASGVSEFLGRKKIASRRIIVFLLMSIILAVFHRGISTLLYNFAYSLYSGRSFSGLSGYWSLRSFGAGIVSSLIYYWILAGIFLGVDSRRKLIRREKELVNARLNALITQLRPHFLFNTLNSISSLIDIDRAGAQKMIARFGELLRGVLEKEKKQFVSLREEIAFIENYLSIELERFSDRLSVFYRLDPETLEDTVPVLILQPLVENALKHGISGKTNDGKIEVSSRMLNGAEFPVPKLEVSICDNGDGLPDKISYGVGLKNVTDRLTELYGGEGEFHIRSTSKGGCLASIRIPVTKN